MQYSLHDKLAIPHALFACIAALFTMPIALLAGRYLRSGPRWFKVHAIFNTITILIIILVFGLGMGAVASGGHGTQFSGRGSDLHHKVGLVIFLIVVLQGIIGFLAHNTPSGHFVRRLHVPFGIIVAAGVYWEVWEGMHNEWVETSTSLTATPESIQILFWALFLVSVTAYAVAVGQDVLRGVASKGISKVRNDLEKPAFDNSQLIDGI